MNAALGDVGNDRFSLNAINRNFSGLHTISRVRVSIQWVILWLAYFNVWREVLDCCNYIWLASFTVFFDGR